MRRNLLMAIMLATALKLVSLSVAAEPLTSRNDEQTKRAIVEFLQQVTTVSKADFLSRDPAEPVCR